MAKSARMAVGEADVNEEIVSAEEKVIGRNRGASVDNSDITVKAASADSGLPVDEKTVESDPVGPKPVDVSIVDGDVVAGNPEDKSVLAA